MIFVAFVKCLVVIYERVQQKDQKNSNKDTTYYKVNTINYPTLPNRHVFNTRSEKLTLTPTPVRDRHGHRAYAAKDAVTLATPGSTSDNNTEVNNVVIEMEPINEVDVGTLRQEAPNEETSLPSPEIVQPSAPEIIPPKQIDFQSCSALKQPIKHEPFRICNHTENYHKNVEKVSFRNYHKSRIEAKRLARCLSGGLNPVHDLAHNEERPYNHYHLHNREKIRICSKYEDNVMILNLHFDYGEPAWKGNNSRTRKPSKTTSSIEELQPPLTPPEEVENLRSSILAKSAPNSYSFLTATQL